MNVPFSSSGATSRDHYRLVRRVESATTFQDADRILVGEVESLEARLSRPGLVSDQIKECLILLLYCYTTAVTGISSSQLEFALPHAVSLAEAGSSLSARRVGYLFCTEIMPPDHELRLMLVNTLRKDLESLDTLRICLSLDYIIQSPSDDVVPAIQSQLRDLISYNSPYVRRRAILACRALASHDSSIIQHNSEGIMRRLKDTEPMVLASAITVCTLLQKNGLIDPGARSAITNILRHSRKSLTVSAVAKQLTLNCLRFLRSAEPSMTDVQLVLDLIHDVSTTGSRTHSILLESFRVLQSVSLDQLSATQRPKIASAVADVRHLLSSDFPADRYVFLSCIECVHPDLWAGTSPETTAVLDAWEVERIMQLLESPDKSIRRKTLRLLSRVDNGIVTSYFDQLSQALDGSFPPSDELVCRLLEIVEVLSADNGETYAQFVQNICKSLTTASKQAGPRTVCQPAVEAILAYVVDRDSTFNLNFATNVLTTIVDSSDPPNSTFMVIAAALACEYTGRVPVAPTALLQTIASKVQSYPASVQDACLLTMLRLAAECDKVPPETMDSIVALGVTSGRHIQRRCDQFRDLANQHDTLKDIISNAQSRSLPDFVAALETYQPSPSRPSRERQETGRDSASRRSSSVSSRTSQPGSKLRYAAYDPPPPVSRTSRPRIGVRTASSSRSTTSLDPSEELRPGSALSGMSGHGPASDDVLSRTATAGELALAAGSEELRRLSETTTKTATSSSRKETPIDQLGSRVDLISLDSPFVAEPVPSSGQSDSHAQEIDFKALWDSPEDWAARGWLELPSDAIVRRLQGLQCRMIVLSTDQPPFEGELKVLLLCSQGETQGTAALRLRETEDDSCLWRLRCDGDSMLTEVKRALNGGP